MDSTTTVLAVLSTISPFIVPFLFAAAILLYEHFVQQLPAQQRAQVEHTVQMLVAAEEQICKAVPGSGAFKKAEVIKLAQQIGLKVTPQELDLLIEATVTALPKSA